MKNIVLQKVHHVFIMNNLEISLHETEETYEKFSTEGDSLSK